MHSLEVSQFKSFPFLRDELFLEILSQLKAHPMQKTFGEFLFKAQCTYYQCHIQPNFTVGQLLALSTKAPPQCPFSRAKTGENLNFIIDESVVKSRLSFFHRGRVSVSSTESFEKPNFQIVSADSAITAQDAVIYSGNHFKVDVTSIFSQSLVILSNKATFEIVHPENSVIKALSEVKETFTAADIKCLLRSSANFYVFVDDKLPEVLNTLIYAKIMEFPLNDALSSISGSTTPSRLEPYLEILTADYIYENQDLFA